MQAMTGKGGDGGTGEWVEEAIVAAARWEGDGGEGRDEDEDGEVGDEDGVGNKSGLGRRRRVRGYSVRQSR